MLHGSSLGRQTGCEFPVCHWKLYVFFYLIYSQWQFHLCQWKALNGAPEGPSKPEGWAQGMFLCKLTAIIFPKLRPFFKHWARGELTSLANMVRARILAKVITYSLLWSTKITHRYFSMHGIINQLFEITWLREKDGLKRNQCNFSRENRL